MKKSFHKNDIVMSLLKGRTLIVLIVLLIYFGLAAPNFFTPDALLFLAKHVALDGIIALGMTYVIITGGIDLSVGSVVGLAGMVAGGLLSKGLTLEMFGVTVYFGVPWVILFGLLVGAVVGLLNGVIITKFNVAPFIATLGMMHICRGVANLHSNGATYSGLSGHPALGNTGFNLLAGRILNIPVGVVVLAVMSVFAAVVLRKTPFGWHVKAIGGNETAARLSGVKAHRTVISVYVFSGICAAMAGLINTAQLAAAHPATGDGWEMNAIAAAVLGGTSMSGGIGAIGGTIVGAFVIGVLNDGMTMCGVSEFWQKVIKGLVIILAVIIDQFQRKMQERMALQVRNEETTAKA